MENIFGFIIFAAFACGMGYFVYTRIMKKRSKKALENEEKKIKGD